MSPKRFSRGSPRTIASLRGDLHLRSHLAKSETELAYVRSQLTAVPDGPWGVLTTFRARSEQIVRYLQLSSGSTGVREAVRDDLEESIAEVAISELEPLCSSTAVRGAAVRALEEAGLDFLNLDASDTVARQAETAGAPGTA